MVQKLAIKKLRMARNVACAVKLESHDRKLVANFHMALEGHVPFTAASCMPRKVVCPLSSSAGIS